MIYEKIEQLAQSEETLPEILSLLTEEFELVERYAELMKTNLTSEGEYAIETLNKLAGAYGKLNIAHKLIDTEKRGREIKKEYTVKMDAGVEGKKVTDGAAKTEASLYVQPYRRVRNIIAGYMNSCDKCTSNLQSVLKYLSITYHKPNE